MNSDGSDQKAVTDILDRFGGTQWGVVKTGGADDDNNDSVTVLGVRPEELDLVFV
jgi:hypothetical protein